MASALVGCNAVLGYDTATLEASEPSEAVRGTVVGANHASGEIMRAARAVGPRAPLARGLPAPSGVAFDGTGATLYYVVQGAGAGAGRLFGMTLP